MIAGEVDVLPTERRSVRELPRVLTARAVPPGVQRKDGGLDAELVGDGLDDRGVRRLVQAQGAAEVAYQGELHGEAELVV